VNIVGERRRSADHVATQLGTAQRQLLVVREDEDRAQRLVDDERAKLAELNEQVAAESTYVCGLMPGCRTVIYTVEKTVTPPHAWRKHANSWRRIVHVHKS
jgi:hypothetical protein